MPQFNKNTGMNTGMGRGRTMGNCANGRPGGGRGICRSGLNGQGQGLRRSGGFGGEGQPQGATDTQELSRQVAENRSKLDSLMEKVNKLFSTQK